MPSINSQSTKHRTHRYIFASCALILTGLCVLYYPVLKGLWAVWFSEDQYSYGILVPALFAYFAWKSWPSLSRVKPVSNAYGLVIVFFGYLLFLFGSFALHGFSARFSLICLLSGFTIYVAGFRFLRKLAFPFFILLFMIPFPESLDRYFSFNLRLLSSGVSAQMLHLFGIPAFREGNVIDIGSMQFNVIDACSGMNYVLPMLLLCAIMGAFFLRTFRTRIILFLLAVPVSFAANVFRITATAVIAQYWSARIATGFLHDFSGWLVFMFALCCTCIMALILRRVFEKERMGGNEAGGRALETEAECRDVESLKARPLLIAACLMVFFIVAYYGIAAKKGNGPIPRLEELPVVISGYGSTVLPEDPAVKEFSSVTDSLTRFYQREGSRPIVVYVGYYRTSSDLKGLFHTPSVCLTGSGWEVKHLVDHELSGDNRRLRTRLVFSEKPGRKQVMLYWYTIGPYTTGHERTAHFYTGYDAIFGHYSDVVKVMISTEYDFAGELDSCVKELDGFASAFLIPFYHQIIDNGKHRSG